MSCDFIVLLMVVSLMVGYWQFSLQNTLQLLHLYILNRLGLGLGLGLGTRETGT